MVLGLSFDYPMFSSRVSQFFNRVGPTCVGNVSSKRTGWFTVPINSKIEVSNLTNNNFIKIGDTYYNPYHIKSIKINDGIVEMKLRDSRYDVTRIYDENAVHHFTNFFHGPTKK